MFTAYEVLPDGRERKLTGPLTCEEMLTARFIGNTWAIVWRKA